MVWVGRDLTDHLVHIRRAACTNTPKSSRNNRIGGLDWKGDISCPIFSPFSSFFSFFSPTFWPPTDFHDSWSWRFPGLVLVPRASEPMQACIATSAHSFARFITQHELWEVPSRSWTWETIFWGLLVEKKGSCRTPQPFECCTKYLTTTEEEERGPGSWESTSQFPSFSTPHTKQWLQRDEYHTLSLNGWSRD